MDVIARIETLTQERGWSRYRLAQKSQLPPTTIANIFNRGTVPSIVTLEILCDAFQISLCEFFIETADSKAILTSEQKRLLACYDLLTPKQRGIISDLIQNMNTDAN